MICDSDVVLIDGSPGRVKSWFMERAHKFARPKQYGPCGTAGRERRSIASLCCSFMYVRVMIHQVPGGPCRHRDFLALIGPSRHLGLARQSLVQSGLDFKSPFKTVRFRASSKPDWPDLWDPWPSHNMLNIFPSSSSMHSPACLAELCRTHNDKTRCGNLTNAAFVVLVSRPVEMDAQLH
jgi:hypothetical protein